jgi:hypothetical protein
MNCHNNQDKKSSPIKHMLHMVLCCGLPFLIVLSLPFISKYSPQAAGLLGLIAPFICPIMMGSMFFMIIYQSRKSNKKCCEDQNELQ